MWPRVNYSTVDVLGEIGPTEVSPDASSFYIVERKLGDRVRLITPNDARGKDSTLRIYITQSDVSNRD